MLEKNIGSLSALCLMLLMLCTAGSMAAQSQWKVSDELKAVIMYVKEPLFIDMKDSPGLPRVLIIGDSISMQYTPQVRRLLGGKANVYRIPENGLTTKYGLAQLEYWLGDDHWAVIHFNFGMHDIIKVSIDDYRQNLRQLVKRLQATGAKLVWASTTPVPPGGVESRHEETVLAYNEVAKKIMLENHVAIDDLHAFINSWGDKKAEWQLPHNVHFRPEGYTEMAWEVASSILAASRQ